MNVAVIDQYATSGHGGLHAASPQAKLVAFAAVLTAVVVTRDLGMMTGLALVLAALVPALRLPARHAYPLALYPALFAVIFAFAGAADLGLGALIVAKAVSAAMAAVLLVFTTPYPQVFAPVQRVTPAIVGDALLMTYRAFFLLAEKFGHLLTAVRLRAGLRGTSPVRSGRFVVTALGGLLLYSFDLSERTYDVMRLRGYSGRLKTTLPKGAPGADAATLMVAAAALASASAWRLGGLALVRFSWMPALAGLGFLLLAWLTRVTTGRTE